MQARQIRNRHFKSTLGSMLNENYGCGLTPETVQTEDFVYIPNTSLPISRSALKFLDHKFPEPKPQKPRTDSVTDSLYQAYKKAYSQPQMMVHYDREPLYWEGQRKMQESDTSGSNNLEQDLLQMEDYGSQGLVPSAVTPASTPITVSSVGSSRVSSSRLQNGKIPNSMKSNTTPHSGKSQNGATIARKPPSGKLEDNRHRLWTPGSEAVGFKPYSPFSDSLYDFGKKEVKFIPPEIPEEFDRTCDVIPAPKYNKAFQRMLDVSSRGGDQAESANVLKVHGNPEYPDKVMADKDVPNYIAWTKVFPYCPLTQVEGKEKPIFVPPRGFTPSTASHPPTPYKDTKKIKQNILSGIKPGSAGSNSVRKGSVITSPPAPQPSLAMKLLKHQQKLKTQKCNKHQYESQQNSEESSNRQKKTQQRRAHSVASENFEKNTTRRILDMKMEAPDVWYSGKTPTHTPTPDYTLPIKPSRDWINHYSPQRVRHFLRAAGEPRTPS